MARRRKDSEDSLELLLDTMCNTFGGIVFIAMLLALLTVNAKVVPVKDTETEQRRIRLERAELEALLGDLRQDIANLDREAATNAALLAVLQADPRSEMLAERADLEAQLASLQGRAQELQSALNEAGKDRQDQRSAIANMKETVERMQREIVEMKAELATLNASRRRNFRLPMTRGTNKTPVWTIVSGGKLYFVSKVRDNRVLDSSDPRYVDERSIFNGSVFTIIPEAGLDLSTDEACLKALELINTIEIRRRNFIDVTVYEDSFPEFIRLKAQINALGISYNWLPFKTGTRYVLYYGEPNYQTQ